MRIQNITNFIKLGLAIKPEVKNFRKFGFYMLSFPILCVILALLINSNFKIVGFVSPIVWLISSITILIVSYKQLTVKLRLIIASIIYFSITLQLCIISFLCYFIHRGIDIFGLFLFTPIIIAPIIFCIRADIIINKDKKAYKNNFHTGKVIFGSTLIGATSVIIGRYISRKLINFPVFLVASVIFILIGYFTCCEGPFNIMRLYYFTKLEKQGVITEENFKLEKE